MRLPRQNDCQGMRLGINDDRPLTAVINCLKTLLQYCQFDHLPHLQTMGEGCISTKLRNTRPAHIQQLGSAAMLSQKMEPQISINVIILANRCMEYKIMASNAWRPTFPLTVHLSQKKAVTQMLTKKQCSRERKRLGVRHFSSLGLVR